VATEETAKQAAADAFAEPKQGSSRKKLLLFVIAPLLLLLIAGGGGAYFFLLKPKPEEGQQEQAPPPPRRSVYYNLPEIVVNLSSTGPRTSFLKLSVSLDLESSADVARVQAVMPRIIDNMQTYLRELRTEDLRGTAGLSRMREELVNRVNMAAQPVKVNDVLFLEVLLQ
jgi:flagellar FliL protein